jgi:cytochrome c556
MKTQTVKLKILAVGPIQSSATVKKTTRKVVLKVVEVPTDNAFGHNKDGDNPFDVEIYNHNIENFNISAQLIDEIAHCELIISHYNGNGGPSIPKFLVNDMYFRL